MSRERTRHTPIGFGESEVRGYFRVTKRDAALAIAKQLTASQLRLWLYLMMIDPFADQNGSGDRIYHRIPTPDEMAEKIGSCVDTVEKDLRKLNAIGLLPKWFALRQLSRTETERRIRDRLHEELGGLIEVATPAGRIDLLTDSEIIEVKAIKDWKAALGQVLVYSAFYPEHQKRLHLFGAGRELVALADIEAAVISFGIKVTGEEVCDA